MTVNKPRLLDLFCGAGGVAMGYYRAGFEVVGVDIKPQPHYPFEFHQADALAYPLEGFDAYHASPPCQGYSIMRHLPWLKDKQYPMLINATRSLLASTSKSYVIENVKGAPLDGNFLCGLMFGLHVFRHRLFETNFAWFSPGHPSHRGLYVRPTSSLGGRARDMVVKKKGTLNHQGYGNPTRMCGVGGHNFQLETASQAMGIDWMTREEISQAIPPAYTEYIGKYLMQAVITSKANQ